MMLIINFHRNGGQGKESRVPLMPKRIHYMWLRGKDVPAYLQKCIGSWKRLCPNYEIIRWDESNYDIEKNLYIK